MEKEKYSGKQYETEYLGAIDINDKEFLAALERVKKTSKEGSKFPYYVNYKNALNLARKFQPIDKSDPEKKRMDPTNPKAPLAKDLRIELLDQLGIKDEESDRVKVFTAVGTPLDVFHGVDAFVEIDGKVVTLDITLREDISAKRKADIIDATELPDPDDEKEAEEYLERVKSIAKKVCQELQERAA